MRYERRRPERTLLYQLVAEHYPDPEQSVFRCLPAPRPQALEALIQAISQRVGAFLEREGQKPDSFREERTAVYDANSGFAREQQEAGACVLDFRQHGQLFIVPCQARLLDETDQPYQASYWDNFLFNPAMPGRVSVLGYQPRWVDVAYRERGSG